MAHTDDRREPDSTRNVWLYAFARAIAMAWPVSPCCWTVLRGPRAAGDPAPGEVVLDLRGHARVGGLIDTHP